METLTQSSVCIRRMSRGKRRDSLRFVSGNASIPHPSKVYKGGEDASFVLDWALGVFDGVGSWSRVRVDPGLYSKKLARITCNILKETGIRSTEALRNAYHSNDAIGSTTACVVDIEHDVLNVVNIGDSGFIIIRNGRVWFQTKPQQYYFNCPYQIGRGLDGQFIEAMADIHQIQIAPGDFVVMATDGLWDNLSTQEVLSISTEVLPTTFSNGLHGPENAEDVLQITIKSVALSIAKKASERALQVQRDSPFSVKSKETGGNFRGGKLDDITVICALVKENVGKDGDGPGSPMDVDMEGTSDGIPHITAISAIYPGCSIQSSR